MNSIIIPNGGGKGKNEKLFGTLYYEVLTILDLTIPEYLYLDMVHQLSQKYQWCFKSLDNIASHMNMHRNGVAKIRDRLVSRGLLEKGDKKYATDNNLLLAVAKKISQAQFLKRGSTRDERYL